VRCPCIASWSPTPRSRPLRRLLTRPTVACQAECAKRSSIEEERRGAFGPLLRLRRVGTHETSPLETLRVEHEARAIPRDRLQELAPPVHEDEQALAYGPFSRNTSCTRARSPGRTSACRSAPCRRRCVRGRASIHMPLRLPAHRAAARKRGLELAGPSSLLRHHGPPRAAQSTPRTRAAMRGPLRLRASPENPPPLREAAPRRLRPAAETGAETPLCSKRSTSPRHSSVRSTRPSARNRVGSPPR